MTALILSNFMDFTSLYCCRAGVISLKWYNYDRVSPDNIGIRLLNVFFGSISRYFVLNYIFTQLFV